jgi:hypothetical protein
MFSDINADIYIVPDCDDTYNSTVAPQMIQRLVDEHLDMVIGIRRDVYEYAHMELKLPVRPGRRYATKRWQWGWR